MFIIEKLKLNKFQHVRIPTKKEYFLRVGEVSTNNENYTGDEKADFDNNKTEMLDRYMKEAKSEYDKYVKDLEDNKKKADKKED